MVWLCLQWQWLLFWLGWLCRSGSAGESDGKMAGARKVVITDVNPYRLDLARKMGATLAIDVRERKLRCH